MVIAAYNAATYLGDALDSAINQTRPADELILVDDGSTDHTPEVAARYAGQVRYVRQSNQGPAGARNTGLGHASADWVAFLDADDVWFPSKLERQCAAIEIQDHPALWCTTATVFHETVPAPALTPRPHQPRWELLGTQRLLNRNRIVTSSVLVWRKTLSDAGGFDQRYRGPEDYACWLRLSIALPVYLIQEDLVAYRVVPHSLSQQDNKMRDQELTIQSEFAATYPDLVSSRLQHQGRAAIYYRTAVGHTVAQRAGFAILELFKSVLNWPLSLPEYSQSKAFIRLRLLVRIVRDQLLGGSASDKRP